MKQVDLILNELYALNSVLALCRQMLSRKTKGLPVDDLSERLTRLESEITFHPDAEAEAGAVMSEGPSRYIDDPHALHAWILRAEASVLRWCERLKPFVGPFFAVDAVLRMREIDASNSGGAASGPSEGVAAGGPRRGADVVTLRSYRCLDGHTVEVDWKNQLYRTRRDDTAFGPWKFFLP